MSDTFWADISRWQHVADTHYPLPILTFRVDHGGGIDDNAAGNWAYCHTSPKIHAAIGYVVLRAGQGAAIATRVRDFFGGKPPAKLCLMLDVEGGAQFMGAGDATREADALADVFADWFGDRRRVLGYDNPNDSARWTHPSWLKIVTPRYGTTDPGTWAWQYFGGDLSWPSPHGYPRSCPPFGANVDLNVCHKPLAQVLTDLGLYQPEEIPVDQATFNKLMTGWAKSPDGAEAIADAVLNKSVSADDGTTTSVRRFITNAYVLDRKDAASEASKP